ncbi:leucine-rich repeat extensin-like protein 1 [Copidosoma floridanum]|uniref:leucine-rich repeat extensin-like protein 1 n=1 Tax=Copidosoma floridanum TaxID=29053 RepID=UPI000C6F842A|nr:leucine-rich repeat extensin-like protein 1 [Copidosoma floridanum]
MGSIENGRLCSNAVAEIVLCGAITLAHCQSGYLQTSQNAAILKDQRYLSGDGTFGAAYSQEDGVEFKEESDEYGNRRGSYSYVDPTGQRRTVTYTAGVNGFQASGDHIPSQPPPTPPQPEYVPLPQYNPPDYIPPRLPSRPPRYQLVRRPYEPQYETQEPAYEPRPAPPAPRYNRPLPPPPQPELLQYESPYAEYPSGSLRYDTKYDVAPQPVIGPITSQYRPVPRPTPPSPPPQPPPAPLRYNYNEITTPAPRRFYPPGKLDFNRTPDGFSYTFSKS